MMGQGKKGGGKNLEFLLDKFMHETMQMKLKKEGGGVLRNAPLTYINSISYKK